MQINYIDHKINENKRTVSLNENTGKWIIKEMVKAGYFMVYDKLPIKLDNINITVINFVIDNTCEIDIDFIQSNVYK